jgi:hypothetical protein
MQNIREVNRSEYLSALKQVGKKKNKYNAKRVVVDGRKYDSQREAQVGCEYAIKLKMGLIKSIEYQPKYELIPKPNRICYVADFLVTYPDGKIQVVDVKGVETAVFKLKAKMFKYFYPDLNLVIVK